MDDCRAPLASPAPFVRTLAGALIRAAAFFPGFRLVE